MMLMKYIFNYRRGQDRALFVDTVQNNNVKKKKNAFIQTDRMVRNIHENVKAQLYPWLSQFAEQVLPSTFLLLSLFLNQMVQMSI